MIKIDIERAEVLANGKSITPTPKEFELLAVLAQADGRVLSRQQLQSVVWGVDVPTHTRTVDQHIARLRSKLGSFSSAIITAATKGYKVQPGSFVVVNPPKNPSGSITAVTRYFKKGQPYHSYKVEIPGTATLRAGTRVRIGV